MQFQLRDLEGKESQSNDKKKVHSGKEEV